MTAPSPDHGDDLVPASVRLGNVVPPEDPEDWTRPLTWVAAAGMLGAPLTALGWFWLATPRSTAAPLAGTWLLAAAVAAGAALTGGTQSGRLRALTGTLAAGLFAALVSIVAGAVTAGGRQVEEASPTVAHAVAAAVAGLAGAVLASPLAAAVAGLSSRGLRIGLPALVGVAASALVVPVLFGR